MCQRVYRRVLRQGLLLAVRQMRAVAGDELLRLIVGRASGRPISRALRNPVSGLDRSCDFFAAVR